VKVRFIVLFILFCFLFYGCSQEKFDFPYTARFEDSVRIQTDVSQKFADKAVERFDEVYDAYSKLIPFPSKRKRTFVISVFRQREDFLSYQKLIGPTESQVGFYIPDRGELVLLYTGEGETLRTLFHESFHAYFEDRIIHPPAWLNEGLAQYAETLNFSIMGKIKFGKVTNASTKWNKTLSRMYESESIPHIKDIVERDWPDKHSLTNEQYALSLSMVNFLKSQEEETFNNYLGSLYDRENPRSAFFKIWPDVDELDEQWKKFIKKELRKGSLLRLLP